MPSNPLKDDQACYKWLARTMNNIPPSGINIHNILIDVLKMFPISEKKIRSFLNHHVSVGLIKIEDDMIYKVK